MIMITLTEVPAPDLGAGTFPRNPYPASACSYRSFAISQFTVFHHATR